MSAAKMAVIASNPAPAVMPNQAKQTQAGFTSRPPMAFSLLVVPGILSSQRESRPQFARRRPYDMTSETEAQLASAVMMIRPARFRSNPLAAVSNRFMKAIDASPDEEQAVAEREFDGIANALREAGVRVVEVADTAEPDTPDAVFPNNWMSTHADGSLVLYPMQVANRRPERRPEIIEQLTGEEGFRVSEIIDLSPHEDDGHYLEGTGSLVLDRVNRIAYACLSARTSLDVLGEFSQRLDYDVVAFEATDREGVPIYHTNVMMSVGEEIAVICDEAIADDAQREAVLRSLSSTGHEIVSISFDQVLAMAGNMLELESDTGDHIMAMSGQAHRALSADQIAAIERHTTIVSSPIDNIENSAGGSVRCMLAEIHLPVQDAHEMS